MLGPMGPLGFRPPIAALCALVSALAASACATDDGGSSPDALVHPDAGEPRDADSRPDAGSTADATSTADASADGGPNADASTPGDAGEAPDAEPGPDASGSPDALPSVDAGLPPLPMGDQGIAARYPRDEGIASDPAVLFADDFEGYGGGVDLSSRWSAVYHNVTVTTGAAGVHAGSRGLEMRSPQQSAELSNGVARTLAQEQDVLFLRFYSKFEATFDVVGSSHNGGGMSSRYFVNGNATPGVPADGTNKFLVEFESWRGAQNEPNPGRLNVYIYHPEQRSQWGDHFFPDGTVLPNTSVPGDFGPEFVARPHLVPDLGRWYAYELMLKANTPGQRDGRIACWVDGVLVADFPNLRLRDVPTLRIDRFNLSLHTGSNPVAETRKWYDDVVVATEYIGPRFVP